MAVRNCKLQLMNLKNKILVITLITLALVIIDMMLSPIPQDQSYHNFADQRTYLSIPNFSNVITNISFVIIGIIGLGMLKRSSAGTAVNIIYSVIFAGIFLTGLGSAYYHYNPDNNTLVFDRIPMTLVFMAFLSATVSEWIDLRAGILLLIPLLGLGILSVLWWHHTELNAAGDLRVYAFVQFYPMIAIPVIFFLFRSSANNAGLHFLIWVIVWYLIAKIAESFDKQIYSMTRFISGHSVKHIAATIATWYILKFFRKRHVQIG